MNYYDLDGHTWKNSHKDLGGAGFGGKDWDYAKSLGLNNTQLRVLGQQMHQRGWLNGPRVERELDAMDQLPWNFGGDGNGAWGFGRHDIRSALDQGKHYDDIKGYADHARSQMGEKAVGKYANDWLADNNNNPAYMSYPQQEAYTEAKKVEAAAEQKQLWEEEAAKMKELNPTMRSGNASMTAGNAGGVRIKRSDEWKNSTQSGRNRGTSALSRALLIGGLNI